MQLSLKKDVSRYEPIKAMETIKSTLLAFDDILFAYLYGSFARGNKHKFSDIDIAVYLRNPNAKRYLNILGALEIKGREIDLRILNNSPPLFRYRVIKDGILLFCRDEKLYEEFVFRTLIEALEYIDTFRRILLSKVYSDDI